MPVMMDMLLVQPEPPLVLNATLPTARLVVMLPRAQLARRAIIWNLTHAKYALPIVRSVRRLIVQPVKISMP
jgi:hypothetical protein